MDISSALQQSTLVVLFADSNAKEARDLFKGMSTSRTPPPHTHTHKINE